MNQKAAPAELARARAAFNALPGGPNYRRPRDSVWPGEPEADGVDDGGGMTAVTLVVAEEFDAARLRRCLRECRRRDLSPSRLANSDDGYACRVGSARLPVADWFAGRDARARRGTPATKGYRPRRTG